MVFFLILIVLFITLFFFFSSRRRHTRSLRDWSSDVCSSDLDPWFGAAIVVERGGRLWLGTDTPLTSIGNNLWRVGPQSWTPERASFADFIDEIGRASCRERVEISVGGVSGKKKKRQSEGKGI